MSASDLRRRGGADDDAAGEPVRLAELLDDVAQPRPLLAGLDLPRHADVIDGRHEDQEAPRHRDVRGEPRPLGAERLLDDLDQDLLALLQQVLDLRLGLIAIPIAVAPAAVPAAGLGRLRQDRRDRLGRRVERQHGPFRGRLHPLGGGIGQADGGVRLLVLVVLVVVAGEALELLDGVDDFSDVEERVALEPDVDERRLHPREDLGDPSLVDVADDAALILALDEDLDDLVVLENGDARVVRAGGDDHLLVHGNSNRG